MTDRHDGGPAFPADGWARLTVEMTLRDYFAGQALNKGVVNGDWCSTVEWRAKSAYEMADAMLAARSEAKP